MSFIIFATKHEVVEHQMVGAVAGPLDKLVDTCKLFCVSGYTKSLYSTRAPLLNFLM